MFGIFKQYFCLFVHFFLHFMHLKNPLGNSIIWIIIHSVKTIVKKSVLIIPQMQKVFNITQIWCDSIYSGVTLYSSLYFGR